MKKIMFLIALIIWLALPVASYAEAEGVRIPKITDPLCCYDHGGKLVAKCEKPYEPFYHMLTDQCYPTLEECKTKDGDIKTTTFCIKCILCKE